MKRQVYGMARLLAAIGVFAVAFAISRPFGARGVLVGFLVSLPIALLVLIVRNNDAAVRWSVASSAIGALVGFLSCPMVHPPYEPGDEFIYMIVGVVIGWVIGTMIYHVRVKDGR